MTTLADILEGHMIEGSLEPGEIVTLRVDAVMMNDGSGPLVARRLEEWGLSNGPFDVDRVFVIPDHRVPARDIASANDYSLIKKLARENDFSFYDTGRNGISHVVLQEDSLVGAGDLLVGGDSHTCTAGAVGCLGLGMGASDVAAALVLGQTWLRVPETRRVVLTGEFKPWTHAYDVMLLLAAKHGTDWAIGSVLEFSGDALAHLPLEELSKLCNLSVELGAVTGLIANDPERSPLPATEIDVGEVGPYVARPGSPGNGVPLGDIGSVNVDQVFIGSCTNGSLSDLREATSILRGRKVHDSVRVVVTPGSSKTMAAAAEEGIIADLVRAGVSVGPSTCGPCSGSHLGILGPGDVCVATSSRNFAGRMGSPEALIYLANPAVAAASAVVGRIASPDEL